MNSFKWGIIGPGKIAQDFAKDIKLVSPTQKLVAVLSDHEKSVNEFADKFQIKERFTHPEDFINKSESEIVYIATPHTFHYDQIKACLIKRICVLCEKPIVINHDQLEELIKLSNKYGTFLMEAMWVRFLPSFTKLIELVSQGKIGDIISIQATIAFKAPQGKGSRYYDPNQGGGSLLDLGIYPIFLSTILKGMPTTIKALCKVSDKNIDGACSITLSYNNNSCAMLESSLVTKHNGPAEIYGTLGVIRILHPWFEKSPGIEIELNNCEKEMIPVRWKGHGLQFEIEEVIKCVSRGKTQSELMPLILSSNVLKIMDEIRNQAGITYPQFE